MRFANRESAGRELSKALHEFADSNSVVLALPRGGVTLGYEIAKVLHAPLDIVLVRKIGHPAAPEYAVGALPEGGEPIYNDVEFELLDEEWREDSEKEARRLLANRRKFYFGDRYDPPGLSHKTVILVDDGIATGLSMRAALSVVANNHPGQIVVASPVASEEGIKTLEGNFDKLIVLDDPHRFQGSISMYFDDFPQIDDDTVKDLLERSRNHVIRKTTTARP